MTRAIIADATQISPKQFLGLFFPPSLYDEVKHLPDAEVERLLPIAKEARQMHVWKTLLGIKMERLFQESWNPEPVMLTDPVEGDPLRKWGEAA